MVLVRPDYSVEQGTWRSYSAYVTNFGDVTEDDF